MRDNLINIVESGECISEKEMLNYLEGKSTPSEQNRIERHLLECEFCSDAFDGLAAQAVPSYRKNLDELDKRLRERIGTGKSTINPMQWYYRIAAVVLAVVIFGGGLYYLRSLKKSDRVFTDNFSPYRDTGSQSPPAISMATAETDSVNHHDKKNSPEEDKKNSFEGAKKDALLQKGLTTATTVTTKNESADVPFESAPAAASEEKKLPETEPDQQAGREEDSRNMVAMNKKAVGKSVADELKNIESFRSAKPSVNELREKLRTGMSDVPPKSEKAIAPVTGDATLSASGNPVSASALLVKSGIDLYLEKNYSGAIGILEEVLRKDPANAEALFYSGVSHLALSEEADAIKLLESLLKNSPNKFSEAAKWYLSLAYIKKNKTAKAKKLLEELSQGISEYKANAQRALEELK